MRARRSISIQEPLGVSAFHDATASRNGCCTGTTGEIRAPLAPAVKPENSRKAKKGGAEVGVGVGVGVPFEPGGAGLPPGGGGEDGGGVVPHPTMNAHRRTRIITNRRIANAIPAVGAAESRI